jgi:hypothetical protein
MPGSPGSTKRSARSKRRCDVAHLGKILWWLLLAPLFVLLAWLVVPIWTYPYLKGQHPFPKNHRVGDPELERTPPRGLSPSSPSHPPSTGDE